MNPTNLTFSLDLLLIEIKAVELTIIVTLKPHAVLLVESYSYYQALYAYRFDIYIILNLQAFLYFLNLSINT